MRELRGGMSLLGNTWKCRLGTGACLTGLVGDEEAAGGCSEVGLRWVRQLCQFLLQLKVQGGSNVVLYFRIVGGTRAKVVGSALAGGIRAIIS
jgi:hypothetical protein